MHDELWKYVEFGKDEKCSDNQAEDLPRHAKALEELDAWTGQFAAFVAAKGKVEPGRWRAFGYKAPGHFLRDVQLAWREIRMRTGHPSEGSSPAVQEQLGLNQDVTLSPRKGEGEKLRE